MEKSKRVAKVLIGIGALLTTVPLGLCLVSVFSSEENVFDQALKLGWAVWVTVGLLPLGFALLAVGTGFLVKLKRQEKVQIESEDD